MILSGFILIFYFTKGQLPAQDQVSEPLSIIITEIMFDPDPQVGLPGCEYIELYNSSGDTINLNGWSLKVGSKEQNLPYFEFAPDSYVILVHKDYADDFLWLDVQTVPLAKWLTLRNSGQFIVLLDPGGGIVNFTEYHPSQISGRLKREGGWSLELGSLNHPCDKSSWAVSENPYGGTPGSSNSIIIYPDVTDPPKPVRAGIPDPGRILVYLSRPVKPSVSENWFGFEISPPDIRVLDWNYYDHRPWILELEMDGLLPDNEIFSLVLTGEAEDCSGIPIQSGILKFGLPGLPDSCDLVISEIMFDPEEDRVEFICIHNLSDKVLALNELYISRLDVNGEIMDFSKPLDESFLAFPGQEYVITGDAYLFLKEFPDTHPGLVYEIPDMPVLPNATAGIQIMDSRQNIIDRVKYDPDWMEDSDDKGISLERIRLEAEGTDPNNWHPASIVSGGATPGMPNSQRSLSRQTDEIFSVENRIFCPGRGEYQDKLIIHVNTCGPGWRGAAGIWNLTGNLIRELCSDADLPVSGLVKWDGRNEQGRLASPGYYVIIINYRSPEGKRGRWKEACVVVNY